VIDLCGVARRGLDIRAYIKYVEHIRTSEHEGYDSADIEYDTNGGDDEDFFIIDFIRRRISVLI